MAVIQTIRLQQAGLLHVNVESNADPDPDVVVIHGFGKRPDMVSLLALADGFYTQRWFIVSENETSITLRKAAGPGGAIAAPTLRVECFAARPSTVGG